MFFALQQVNTEEELLEFEATQFPILQTMIAYKEPYDKLWRTALTFHNKHEAWLNGMGLRDFILNGDLGWLKQLLVTVKEVEKRLMKLT